MSDCNTCVHKNERCFCPPSMNCMVYKKEKVRVKHIFEFETDNDWIPGIGACWGECAFSALVGLGKRCKFVDSGECPFKRMKK
ncbi:MAG TPA: hypothetical protein DCW90_10435 [Lachnospiraceae bacterium]|nr:hypothetical protein [Lachnospiraceae bacterium]